MQSAEFYDHFSRIYFDICADTMLGKRLAVNFADLSRAIENLNVLITERESQKEPTTLQYVLGYKLYRLRSDIERQLQTQEHPQRKGRAGEGNDSTPLVP